MNSNKKTAFVLWPFLLLCAANNPSAAQENNTSFPSEAISALEIIDGSLSGTGAEAFLESCRSSHFILFGEAHGVAGIAEMVTATNRSLSKDQFRHLIIEAGDWFSNQLSEGETDAVLDHFPYSLAFDYNGDLELIEQVKAAGKNQQPPIIGVDQEANAIHAFDYLSTNAKNYAGRQLSKCLMLKALFQGGKYIRTNHKRDLEDLENRLGKEDNVSLDLVNSVKDSMQIFVDHVEGRIGESVDAREARMMSCFDKAIGHLSPDSRFIFKMGGAHTVRGIGPNGIKTLGEHVAQHANEIGKQSIHINIYPWQPGAEIALPKEFLSNQYVLVNCRDLLNSLDSDIADSALAQQLRQCDWIILMPNAESASKSIIRQKQKRFVRTQLFRVGLVLVPILLLIPVSISSFWQCVGLLRGRKVNDLFLFILPVCFSFLMIGLIAIQVLLLLRSPSSAFPTSYPLTIGLDLFFVATPIIMILGGIKFHRSESQKGKQKVTHWMGVLGCLGLIIFTKYWGLGNLLGI